MSDVTQHLDCLLQRERQKTEQLRQELARAACLIDAWQHAYEGLDRFAAMHASVDLIAVREALETANEDGTITDTIWMPEHCSISQTLFDHIYSALERRGQVNKNREAV